MSATPGAANRTLSLFSSIWNWGVGRKLLPQLPSPAAPIEPYPEEGGERYLSKEEFRRLAASLRKAETVGIAWAPPKPGKRSKHRPKRIDSTVVDPAAVAAIRLLLLTGARLREILHAQIDHLDRDRGILFLSDAKDIRKPTRSKALQVGAKPRGTQKPIYLSPLALVVIDSVSREACDPYLIPGGVEHRNAKGERVYKPRADLKRPWAAIRREAGLGDVRLHDLRHTFASVGVSNSLGLPMIGRLLGHSRPETTARYAHFDADPMQRAAGLITEKIVSAMEQSKG
jgi:integrase